MGWYDAFLLGSDAEVLQNSSPIHGPEGQCPYPNHCHNGGDHTGRDAKGRVFGTAARRTGESACTSLQFLRGYIFYLLAIVIVQQQVNVRALQLLALVVAE